MSVFDPEAFLDSSVEGEMDDHLTPVPPGDRPGQVKSVQKPKEITTDAGDIYYLMEVIWHITDDESKQATGRDEPTCRQTIFLDITPEGSLDLGKGKNVQLGALRTAVGQNKKGKKWSPQLLVGAMGLCHVEPDRKDPDNYSRVTKVAALK